MKMTSMKIAITPSAVITEKAQKVKLDTKILYESVIDLASEGLITAAAINMAAGILLNDLGLPNYFFANINKDSFKNVLASIATSMSVKDGKFVLRGRPSHLDCSLRHGDTVRNVRIAIEETRDSMEASLEELFTGNRRDYYYNPKSGYYTYINRPVTVNDFCEEDFKESRFLFNLAGDYSATPEVTRNRYERFLEKSLTELSPLVEVHSLQDTGETRLMFNSDFEKPQIAIIRKVCRDQGFDISRAYWEPYWRKSSIPSSICSIYIIGELSPQKEATLLMDLRAFLALNISGLTSLYANGELSFKEMLFAVNAADFAHLFLFQEGENATDQEILESLKSKDYKDAFAARIHKSNKSNYGKKVIIETIKTNPDLVKRLYQIFERKFDPAIESPITPEQIEKEFRGFSKIIASRFMDFSIGYDIFSFLFKFIMSTVKTNFYKSEKRSFSFRLDNRILDPLVFNQFVYGIFFVNGHYACGTHMRAADIARGGLRMIRVTPSNHIAELNNAVLLNYALGPKAQRLKHKDICESGSKGVVIPHLQYANGYAREALFDFTEGIMDLTMGGDEVVDFYGKTEMIFFGPDEGSAPLMDAVSFRAKERGYKYWRTITTGKSFGIPHDAYGLLDDGCVFGLLEHGKSGTELQINGESKGVALDMEKIWLEIGEKIATSGMTTTGVMSCFRTMVDQYSKKEENLNLLMTGGPDGDLGANQIQSYRGKICLLIDSGSVLFDPDGLDRKELMKIAFMRHTAPRYNSLQFPAEKIGPDGFRVPITAKNIKLPDGTLVEDGGLFHRTFLFDPGNRKFIESADIQAFIPCGGLKDTVNQSNVKAFLSNFRELAFIVEGANVFFDDSSRRHIAAHTHIKQIKDSSANKGGVFSSSIAEVLTAFLLNEDYEEKLINDRVTRWGLIRDIIDLVSKYSSMETNILLQIHKKNPQVPLFELSETTSEQIFSFQARILENMGRVLKDAELVWAAINDYTPGVLVGKLGRETILEVLNRPELSAYREAILSKKLASMAFYKFGEEWENFLQTFEKEGISSLHEAVT